MYFMFAGHIKYDYKLSIQIDGSVQDCGISSAIAMEIPQSCTKPSIYVGRNVIIKKTLKYTVHVLCVIILFYHVTKWFYRYVCIICYSSTQIIIKIVYFVRIFVHVSWHKLRRKYSIALNCLLNLKY